MNKFRNIFPQAIVMAGLAFSTCWADLSFALKDRFDFSKFSTTVEDLDEGFFEGTAATSDWLESKENITYTLKGDLTWISPEWHVYGKVSGEYGWLFTGTNVDYPLQWNVNGHGWGYAFEGGYIYNACAGFDVIPYIGFTQNVTSSMIKHQRYSHRSPTCFVSRNGSKSRLWLYTPYIGAGLAWQTEFCDKYKLNFGLSYDIGYTGGHGHNKTPYFFATDIGNSSIFGSKTKYRNLITHSFEFTSGYSINKKWQVGMNLVYTTTYNTNNLRTRFQRNNDLVDAGLFTDTQYHRISDYISQTFSVTFAIVYNLTGSDSSGWAIK
jgi:hypothetical protein